MGTCQESTKRTNAKKSYSEDKRVRVRNAGRLRECTMRLILHWEQTNKIQKRRIHEMTRGIERPSFTSAAQISIIDNDMRYATITDSRLRGEEDIGDQEKMNDYYDKV